MLLKKIFYFDFVTPELMHIITLAFVWIVVIPFTLFFLFMTVRACFRPDRSSRYLPRDWSSDK